MKRQLDSYFDTEKGHTVKTTYVERNRSFSAQQNGTGQVCGYETFGKNGGANMPAPMTFQFGIGNPKVKSAKVTE